MSLVRALRMHLRHHSGLRDASSTVARQTCLQLARTLPTVRSSPFIHTFRFKIAEVDVLSLQHASTMSTPSREHVFPFISTICICSLIYLGIINRETTTRFGCETLAPTFFDGSGPELVVSFLNVGNNGHRFRDCVSRHSFPLLAYLMAAFQRRSMRSSKRRHPLDGLLWR